MVSTIAGVDITDWSLNHCTKVTSVASVEKLVEHEDEGIEQTGKTIQNGFIDLLDQCYPATRRI